MPPVVKCPTCGQRVEWSEASRFRPFCSERCKTGDLGAWASNAYVVEGSPSDELLSDESDTEDRRGD